LKAAELSKTNGPGGISHRAFVFVNRDRRVVITPLTGPTWSHLSTVKDLKTGACWIAAGHPDKAGFASLAVAPIMACE